MNYCFICSQFTTWFMNSRPDQKKGVLADRWVSINRSICIYEMSKVGCVCPRFEKSRMCLYDDYMSLKGIIVNLIESKKGETEKKKKALLL
jgi:hypothetical protein